MPHSANKNGLLLALAGFALLSCGDAVIKSIAGAWPGTAVAALRYMVGTAGLAAILYWREGMAGFKMPKPSIQLLRGFAAAFATCCFFISIFFMPLAEATAIQFTSPMITGILSALILREEKGRDGWIAAGVAFVGVLVILRPNIAELGMTALLPLGSAFGMAFVMLGNRAVAGSGSPLQMQFFIAAIASIFIFIAAVAGHFSGIASLHISTPHWSVVLRCAIVAVSASTAHALIYMATMRVSAAKIAPMVYVQMLVALAAGMIFFGDWPDLVSLGGSAIIILAGIFLWKRTNAPKMRRIV